MNNLQIFKKEEFGNLRASEKDGQPYVCLADVCKILEIGNVSQLKTRLKEDGVITNEVIDNLGRKQQATFINESNLYKVIFQSRKPEAERFTDWVTSEVLPSIRKNGMYATNELLDNPDLAIKVFEQLKQEREEKQKLQLENTQQKQIIGELKPKADYLDQILQSKALVTITAIAKDYGMSAKAFNKKLHELKVQFKQGHQWFLYSNYHNCGYTHSETIEYTHSDGRKDVTMNTKWTQKGRLFLYELLKKNGIVPTIEKEVV